MCGTYIVCVTFQGNPEIPLVLRALEQNVETRFIEAPQLTLVGNREARTEAQAAQDMAAAVMASESTDRLDGS